ncbi:uncharacterized protein LOC135199748 [Macrobrachium nipponense]|uniref:uncharacterized protein LOC135199748 n=1 Tax=Macrobrachium nipponense TaxID=159736 RepID=UPI0030C87EEA
MTRTPVKLWAPNVLMWEAPALATLQTPACVDQNSAHAALKHHAHKLTSVPDMVAIAVRSQLDVRALPMMQDAQLQLALAALLILLLVSHYLPAEMLAGRALLLLNRATAQVFSTPMAALETACSLLQGGGE